MSESGGEVTIVLDDGIQASKLLQHKFNYKPEPIPFSYTFQLVQSLKYPMEDGEKAPLDEDEDEEQGQPQDYGEPEEEPQEWEMPPGEIPNDVIPQEGIEKNENMEDTPVSHEETPITDENTDQEWEDCERDELYMEFPSCMATSSEFNCLIVSHSSRFLLFFHLDSKKYLGKCLLPDKPNCVCVEKDGYKGSEALIVTFYNHYVAKYDLREMIRHGTCTSLWAEISGTRIDSSKTSGRGSTDLDKYNWPEHAVVCYSNKYDHFFGEEKRRGNLVFVCDKWNHRIKVLSSSDGRLLGCFGSKGRSVTPNEKPEFLEPWGIDLDEDDNLLVGEFAGHRIKVIGKSENGEMVLLKSVVSSRDMYNPEGIAYDRFTKRVVIADNTECRVSVVDLTTGQFMEPFYGKGGNALQHPSDVCLCSETGELLVCDQYKDRIQVYK